jgi:hypothetical protein
MYYKNVIACVRTVDNQCLILRGGNCFVVAKALVKRGVESIIFKEWELLSAVERFSSSPELSL